MSTHVTGRSGAARTLSAVAAAAALAAAGIAVNAQTTPPPLPGYDADFVASAPVNDAQFVRAFDAANTGELDLAKFVVNRTKNPEVHAFAQRMIDDHSTAAVKLSAATRGTNLAPAPPSQSGDPPRSRALMLLQNETGTQLDNDYMRIQVPAHRRALALLNWESQSGQNAGLRTLATSLMPTVQQHLQIAQNYLASHNLTPYSPPPPNPVPGHPNPPGSGLTPNGTTPNNPAAGPAGGSSSGQNSPGGPGPNPGPGATPAVPFGSGTAAPVASPSAGPMPSPSPRL